MPRSALYPLRRVPFGSIEVSIPAQPEVLLDASYGTTWRTEASLANAHSDRSGKFRLSKEDMVPARPTMPIMPNAAELTEFARAAEDWSYVADTPRVNVAAALLRLLDGAGGK